MKKLCLCSIIFFCIMAFPSFSYAVGAPFGGLDSAMGPCTCSGMAWHFFVPLYLGTSIPISGYMAAPYTPLLYSNYYLRPKAWALGFYTPGVQPCYMIAYPCVIFPVLGVINANTGASL